MAKLKRPGDAGLPSHRFEVKQRKQGAQLERDAPADVASVQITSSKFPVERLREMALIDYVTDPDQRAVAVHYARTDRPWRKQVSLSAFIEWSQNAKWATRRAQWWSQIEARILAKRAEQIANQRIAEIEAMESAREHMMRYLFPLTDKFGGIKYHPEESGDGEENPLAGLPVYGLRMPSIDRFISAFVALDKQIMLKRGEVIERTANSSKMPDVDAHEGDDASTLSKEDLRAMAKVLVRMRQPELAEQPVLQVDGLVVSEDDD